jgi:hypothetical protein
MTVSALVIAIHQLAKFVVTKNQPINDTTNIANAFAELFFRTFI